MNDSLAPDNVLSRMVPGKTYGAYALAAKFHVPTAKIRPVLELLVQGGKLELSHSLSKVLGFRRPQTEDVPVECVVVLTSIATPPMHVRLDGELTGYDAEFRRRAELCMMVRTR